MINEKYFNASNIKGTYQRAVAPDTARVMKDFCDKEPEFMQAVEQSDKTFQQCLDEAVKGIGKSISDEDFYTRAVQVYFPTARVRFRPYLDLSGTDEPDIGGFESLLDF